jgi:1,4-alpha-glucan branching enzyme
MSVHTHKELGNVIKQTPVKGSDKVKVNFVLAKDTVAGKVSVVGDFNGWDPMVHPLRPRSNGTRSIAITLPAQRRFAFRYLDEAGRWIDDDAAHAYEDNGIGGVNSVVHT